MSLVYNIRQLVFCLQWSVKALDISLKIDTELALQVGKRTNWAWSYLFYILLKYMVKVLCVSRIPYFPYIGSIWVWVGWSNKLFKIFFFFFLRDFEIVKAYKFWLILSHPSDRQCCFKESLNNTIRNYWCKENGANFQTSLLLVDKWYMRLSLHLLCDLIVMKEQKHLVCSTTKLKYVVEVFYFDIIIKLSFLITAVSII